MPELVKLIRDTEAYSREGAIARPAARTKEARYLNAMRDRLTAYVGGAPSPVQAVLIERTAWVLLRLELLDADALKARSDVEHQSSAYAELSETAAHLLKQLGPGGALAEVRNPTVSNPASIVGTGAAA